MKLSAVSGLRGDVDEIISALFSFTHPSGFKTDVISELTANAGVTVDGVLLKDGILDLIDKAAAGDIIFQTDVVADTFRRFVTLADGQMEWGPGNAAADIRLKRYGPGQLGTPEDFRIGGQLGFLDNASGTDIVVNTKTAGPANDRFTLKADGRMEWGDGVGATDVALFRAAANVLKLADSFNIQLELDVGGRVNFTDDLQLAPLTPADITGSINNMATGTRPVQRITSTGDYLITGFAGGRPGRVLMIFNVGTVNQFRLQHEAGASTAANRILCPQAAQYVVDRNSGVMLWYDNTSSRWRVMSTFV